MPDVKFDIEKKLGSLGVTPGGWNKELNLVSWNDKPARFEVRDWNQDHTKCGKACSMNDTELYKLYEILQVYFAGRRGYGKETNDGAIDVEYKPVEE